MYRIKIVTNFSAAHFLRNYKGKCEALHGHNWKVEIVVSRSDLDSLGMVIDFCDLKKIADSVLDELDHKNLNDIEYFSAKASGASGAKAHNPSSENIARYIYEEVANNLASYNCTITEVRVWETENSCAMYQE